MFPEAADYAWQPRIRGSDESLMATARFDGRENYAAGDYARETGPRALQFAHDTADSTRLDSLFPRRDSPSPLHKRIFLQEANFFFLPRWKDLTFSRNSFHSLLWSINCNSIKSAQRFRENWKRNFSPFLERFSVFQEFFSVVILFSGRPSINCNSIRCVKLVFDKEDLVFFWVAILFS